MQFFNFYGIPVIAALFIIWMIFRCIDKKYKPPKDTVNRGLKAFEQIGGFAVIFCMVCGFGIQGKGFLSETMRNFWIVSTVFLILLHILSQQKPHTAYDDGNFSEYNFYSYRLA